MLAFLCMLAIKSDPLIYLENMYLANNLLDPDNHIALITGVYCSVLG